MRIGENPPIGGLHSPTISDYEMMYYVIHNSCNNPTLLLQVCYPQGSILGPLFFILYVNDIFSYVKYNNSLTMYADDTLLIEQSRTKLDSVKACQETMDQVEHWCRLNHLTINVDKTKGANPQRVSTEIIIEIKQLHSGRMASHASIESVWCSH